MGGSIEPSDVATHNFLPIQDIAPLNFFPIQDVATHNLLPLQGGRLMHLPHNVPALPGYCVRKKAGRQEEESRKT